MHERSPAFNTGYAAARILLLHVHWRQLVQQPLAGPIAAAAIPD
jgi:hypothetical protein